MSVDIERNPTRLDSHTTKVGIAVEQEFSKEDEADFGERSRSHWSSRERLHRFSLDEGSRYDNPYNSSRRGSRIPNLKGNTPLPGSCLDGHEQFRDLPWRCGDPHQYNPPWKGDAWHKCHKLVEKYDNEMCDAWKEEVDKLLIFAGLFSATITAFTVESYKWLDEQPEDISARLLAHIATQLSNSSSPLPPTLNPPTFRVSTSDVLINAAWFLSLTLSLTTVLIGILCLQWLREFQRDVALPHKDAVALRQMRYEGLLYWRVPEILTTLPVLLQASLVLFFAGLLDLLWSRNMIVAALVSALVAIVMIFLGATTALPSLQHFFVSDRHLRTYQCPYKSPQSWICYRLYQAVFLIFDSVFQWSRSTVDSPRVHRLLKSVGDLNWMRFDMRWRQLRDAQEVVRGSAKKLKDSDDIVHGLQWINDTFSQSIEAVNPIHHAIRDLDIDAASATMSHFYLDIGQIDNDTLRVMLDDRFSPTEDQKRDILSAYYLHLHQEQHPILKASYIETVIRILNSQEVPQPFYDWLSEILQELGTTSYSEDLGSLSLLSPDMNVQVLLCVKSLMQDRHALRTLDMVVTWALINRLLAPAILSVTDDRPLDTYGTVRHLKLACVMFEAFEQWITAGKEIQRWERVKLCAEGMMTIFPPTVDLTLLSALCPDMVKAVSLVRTLEVHFQSLGGPSALLSRGKWWLEYWQVFSEDDWRRTILHFETIAPDG